MSAPECVVDVSPSVGDQITSEILSRYAADAAIDATIQSSQCLGASPCVVHTTKPGILSLTRVVVGPDGDITLERELGDTPERTGEVLDACFGAVGLEPAPMDIAVVQTAMWSTFLSLEVSELPAEGVASLSDDVLADFDIDFDDSATPVVTSVDGNRVVQFIAEDQVANYYVVETVLEPDVVSTVSVVFVG